MEQSVMLKKLQSGFWFRLFLLKSLPAAFFSGIKLDSVTEESSIVSIRYTWFSQNPFRSIYFACLGMAAEMSSGILSLIHTQHHRPSVSMLVLSMKADFHKKAVGNIKFKCNDGTLIKNTIEDAIKTQTGQTCVTHSKGFDEAGNCIAEFYITWTFKQKSIK